MKHSFYCTSYTSLLANNVYGFSRLGFSGFCCFHLIFESPVAPSNEYPFTCSKQSKPCKSLLYSVDISQIQTFGLGANQDYLVTVPCSCHNVNNGFTYFYKTLYLVKNNATFFDVSNEYYSGQAWPTGDERFQPNKNATIYLQCGCTETDSQVMFTKESQVDDNIWCTLSNYCTIIRCGDHNVHDEEKILKTGYGKAKGFDTERPLVYDLDEIAEATNNFDDTKLIGEGGYGSVYFGILGEKVELLGFASGDDHLYLVYEFVSNGSLNEHLHDPLLKGHQPFSWTARAQIKLDAAKGTEYIHDHTKERYVHRDIKTSNILLDKGLRAKVADFGLAKLVGRTNDDDFIATRLVRTPGYLPPE
ncbi:LysM domain receptor-like kinase 3 [Tanacetum coccineum]